MPEVAPEVHGGTRSAPPPVADTSPEVISTNSPDDPVVPTGQRPQVVIPGRPDGLPEQFADVSALVESWKSGQAKITELSAKPPTAGVDEAAAAAAAAAGAPAADPNAPAIPAAPAIGTLMDDAALEYATTGSMSAETNAKFLQAGFSQAAIDNHMRGVKAQETEQLSEIHRVAGGEAAMNLMFAWASDNLPAPELHALNSSLDAGGPLATQAVQALSASYHASEGTVPKILTADGNRISTGDGMDVYPAGPDGRRMMVADMKDPRYKDISNPAFRRQIEAKIDRSNLA